MSQSTSLIFLLVALIVGVGVGFGLRPLLPKLKGAPKEVLAVADTVIGDVKKVEETVGKVLLPAPESNLIDKILQAAQTGVHKAQQLFNSGQVSEDQRKQVAFNAAMNLLTLTGLKSSPELETAVNDAIEKGVFIMKSFSAPQAAPADANTVDVTAAAPTADSVSVAPVSNTPAVSNPAQATVVQTVQQEAQKASNQAVQNVIQQFTNAVQNAVQQPSAADMAAEPAQDPAQG